MSPTQKVQPSAIGPRRYGENPTTPASAAARIHALVFTVGLIVVTLGIGWLIFSIAEWGRSSTPGFRMTSLHVVRRSDGARAGIGRMLLREACCVVLILPTMVVCGVLGIVFLMGASPPDDLLGGSHRTPWDILSGTEVVQGVRPPLGFAELTLAPPGSARSTWN